MLINLYLIFLDVVNMFNVKNELRSLAFIMLNTSIRYSRTSVKQGFTNLKIKVLFALVVS